MNWRIFSIGILRLLCIKAYTIAGITLAEPQIGAVITR
jgi:hypothetical protein